MEHYICKGGCQGVSDTQGACQNQDCPNYGKSLEECNCMDNKHGGAFEERPQDSREKGTNNGG